MEGLVNYVRDFAKDNRIDYQVKCMVVVTAVSLSITPIAVFTTILEKNRFISQSALYVSIFDITAVWSSLAFWLGLFFYSRNKDCDLVGRSYQETTGPKLQCQNNTSNVEVLRPDELYAPVGNEVIPLYNFRRSANRCGLSPTQECIQGNDNTFNYEDVSIPTTRPGEPNILPKINNEGKTYTLHSLERGQETFIGAEASLYSDHSRLFSRVPLKCCFESDKANVKNEPDSAEIFRGREFSTVNQQNVFRSSSMLTNQSRQIDVPDRGIQPSSKDISSYCGNRRPRCLPRKRIRTLSVRQVKNLAVADRRPYSTTTSEEDLIANCNPKQKPHVLLRHSNTLPPLRQDRNSVIVQDGPFLTMNEKNSSNNYVCGQNRGFLQRERCKSAPSSRSKALEDAEGRSCLKTNDNFSSNSGHIQSGVGSPTKNIVLPPSPSCSRPRLLHGLLTAILTSNTAEHLPDFGSSESIYFQPQASGANTPVNDSVRHFPIVSYDETSSNNYLMHVAMIFSPEELQNFLSKRG